ncbi:hypothetical protein AAG570_012382 [Ranatra chinensis]|uniref:Uncharacterized protein n=1 Tax=Ranatra chinensis TaxID=642074 RepID=A0ABD0YIM8_9HEMI
MAPKVILNPALFKRIISQKQSKFDLIKFDLHNLDPDNLPDPIDAQLGLDQLEDIYHEARENLKPFLTAPESVESFHEEEMFPLSDRLYSEYYAIFKYLRRTVSAVDSKPSISSTSGIHNPTSFDLSIASIPKLEVTPFDGDFKSFDACYASFTSIIHENAIFSNTQKLQYLINALDKLTKNIIAHLPLQDASYQRALDLLKARFSNPLRAVTAHTDSILKLPNLDNPTAKSLLLLATALVKLYTSKTNFMVVRAVLDSASQASFVSEAVVNSLKIKRDHSAIPISGNLLTLQGAEKVREEDVDQGAAPWKVAPRIEYSGKGVYKGSEYRFPKTSIHNPSHEPSSQIKETLAQRYARGVTATVEDKLGSGGTSELLTQATRRRGGGACGGRAAVALGSSMWSDRIARRLSKFWRDRTIRLETRCFMKPNFGSKRLKNVSKQLHDVYAKWRPEVAFSVVRGTLDSSRRALLLKYDLITPVGES